MNSTHSALGDAAPHAPVPSRTRAHRSAAARRSASRRRARGRGRVADPAKQVPRPPEGAWKLTAVSSPSELISAGFTLSGSTVSDLHGKLRAMQGCTGGNFTVNGTFKIAAVTFSGGVRQWTVGSGRNFSGGLAARSVVLQINGHKQDDATLTIAFPGSGQKGAGELNWGIQQTAGISPCTTEYYVTHG